MSYKVVMVKAATQAIQGAAHPSTKETASVVATGAGALILSLMTEYHITVLFIVLIVMISMDLFTGIGAAIIDDVDSYDKPRLYGGMIGKLMIIATLFIAGGIDLVLVVVEEYVERVDLGFADLWPTTTGAFVWLIAGEASSALVNIRKARGVGAIPSIIIRAIDLLRYQGEGTPPRRRHYDKVELAERNEILRQMERPPKVEEEDS